MTLKEIAYGEFFRFTDDTNNTVYRKMLSYGFVLAGSIMTVKMNGGSDFGNEVYLFHEDRLTTPVKRPDTR